MASDGLIVLTEHNAPPGFWRVASVRGRVAWRPGDLIPKGKEPGRVRHRSEARIVQTIPEADDFPTCSECGAVFDANDAAGDICPACVERIAKANGPKPDGPYYSDPA